MFEKFKAWLKTRVATTPCAVLPGDIIVVRVNSQMRRDCDHNGVYLGTVTGLIQNKFEWRATRPFRTVEDAIWAAHQTIDVQYVQTKDTI